MRRIQFIELHDQRWFPASLRDEVTETLQYGMNLLNFYGPVVPILRSLLETTVTPSIVDLCSGAGGPWLRLFPAIRAGGAVQILLTDKYPNWGAFERIKAASQECIEFGRESVEAADVPRNLAGVRTVFTSFHHFPPEQAVAVLRDAVEAREAIAIFEATARSRWAIACMLPWAMFALLYTPFVRPFRWSRLLWTYPFPVIPLVLLFDGIVSCLRSYRVNELLEIADKVQRREYAWASGELPTVARAKITYLTGRPQPVSNECWAASESSANT